MRVAAPFGSYNSIEETEEKDNTEKFRFDSLLRACNVIQTLSRCMAVF